MMDELKHECPEEFSSGPSLEINQATGRAYWNGKDLGLQKLTFSLLCFLASSVSNIYSKEELYVALYADRIVEDNQVAFQLSRLRKAFLRAGYFGNVVPLQRGLGYQLRVEESAVRWTQHEGHEEEIAQRR